MPKHLEKIKDLYPYDFIKFMASKKFARYKKLLFAKSYLKNLYRIDDFQHKKIELIKIESIKQEFSICFQNEYGDNRYYKKFVMLNL